MKIIYPNNTRRVEISGKQEYVFSTRAIAMKNPQVFTDRTGHASYDWKAIGLTPIAICGKRKDHILATEAFEVFSKLQEGFVMPQKKNASAKHGTKNYAAMFNAVEDIRKKVDLILGHIKGS